MGILECPAHLHIRLDKTNAQVADDRLGTRLARRKTMYGELRDRVLVNSVCQKDRERTDDSKKISSASSDRPAPKLEVAPDPESELEPTIPTPPIYEKVYRWDHPPKSTNY